MTQPALSDFSREVRSYTIAQGDPGISGDPFPPYDVQPLPGGFSADILAAVCDANREMDCEIVVRSYADCLFQDLEQPTGVGIGPVLLGDDVVGCLTWLKTFSRASRGVVFTDAYSNHAAPGTNDSVILSMNGSVNTGNELVSDGSFGSALCARAAGYDYASSVVQSVNDAIAAVDSDTDAIILAALLPQPLPNGVQVAATVEVDGSTPLRCGNGFRVIAYPSGDFEETHSFISDFNCGLSLIAQNGTYQEICAMYAPNSSVAPYCFDPTEIDPPSRECKRLENRSRRFFWRSWDNP